MKRPVQFLGEDIKSESIKSILAFDPGGTTGWACLREGQLAGGSFPLWSKVEHLLVSVGPDIVVCEDFLLYPGKAQHLYWNRFEAVQVIGVLKFLTDKFGIPLVMQTAAQGKAMKVVRVHEFNKHATDALRHALRLALRLGVAEPYSRFRWKAVSYPTDDGLERP